MLELNTIKKDYPSGDGTVHALKGVSTRFREHEFVSILGPSGCGKTTLLNIIGGLDQYSAGDLLINGRSTKEFRDRDWDAYRNHSVGFVFQSYNLIPHQTVLQNVELALTLSGVSRGERRRRAVCALEDVGLGDQLKKRPNQLSGGQMQRVAIARALVNDPDIILADEPTGALDTQTSVQVMEILKEVAGKRLVVMVTHNPELAETYSSRIIRMLDGEIISDSNPLSQQEYRDLSDAVRERAASAGKIRKPSMSARTSFGLSLKNLISKKGRTALTSFAGSIGIIGIALIYAVSQGMTTYINTLQEDTLASYPLTIQATHTDMGSLMTAFMEAAQSQHQHEADAVYSKPAVYDMINALNSLEATRNDLAAFKRHIEAQRADPESDLHQSISGVRYSYDLDLQIYTKSTDGRIIPSDTMALMQEMMGSLMGMDSASMSGMNELSQGGPMMSMMSGGGAPGMNLWQEMLPGEDGQLISPLLSKQYDVVYGAWPTAYNEIVLVLDENNELDDMTLYALGLKTEEEIHSIMQAALNGDQIQTDTSRWSYEEICGMKFHAVVPSDCYVLEEATGLYTDLRRTDAGLRYLYDNGLVLKVSGIIRPSEDAVSAMLTGSMGYTTALTEHIIRQAADSDVVAAQKENPTTDIFTGLPFEENTGSMTDETKEQALRDHIAGLDTAQQADAYIRMMSIPSQEQLDGMVAQSIGSMTRADMQAALVQAMTQQMGMDADDVTAYAQSMSDQDLTELFAQMVAEQVKQQYAAQVEAQMSAMSDQQLAGALTLALKDYTTQQCALYYDEILEFSDSTCQANLVKLGCLDLDDPASIHLYAATFESKDVIEQAIAQYNKGVDELSRISYTDYVGLMMSSVTSMINAVTYVLIAFVAISLVVSSIMIGVITLISVQERTKEIGILRAIGASKKNVSSMFIAETVMIGFASGGLGVAVTWILCIPINAVIQHLTGLANLNAFLPWQTALVLVGVSMVLTVFAGIIPSRSAARKDPVVALRTE